MKEGTGSNVSKQHVKNIPSSLYGAFVHVPCKRHEVNEIIEEYIKKYVSGEKDCRYIDISNILDNLSYEQLKYIIPSLKDRVNKDSIYRRVLEYSGKNTEDYPPFGSIIIFSASYTVSIELTESLIATYLHFKESLNECYQKYINKDKVLYSAVDDIFPMEPILGNGSNEFYRTDCTAERYFTESISQLSDEIRERVNKLKILGVEESFIKALFEPKKTLSRLLITKDYRIFLPDYGNIEIKMEPLPKAVYLLFLKYDSGIVFKELPFYHYDLRKIYVCVTKSYNLDIAENSLERVLDPTNNSINEKCSRIREAFVSQIDESIARNYYINGKRACPKRIALDRKLLITEIDL